MNPQEEFFQKYEHMNHRLSLMKDGVKKMHEKDSDFTQGKMSDIVKRMKRYTDKVEGYASPGRSRVTPSKRKELSQDKAFGLRNNFSPNYMPGNVNSIDIHKTMKIYRGFQTSRDSFMKPENPGRRSRNQVSSKAAESYQKRMQRDQLSRMIQPFVQTPEPRRSGFVNDGFRQSIDIANRRYYELKNSRQAERPNNYTRQNHSNLVGGFRSRSSNTWRHAGLQGISGSGPSLTGRGGGPATASQGPERPEEVRAQVPHAPGGRARQDHRGVAREVQESPQVRDLPFDLKEPE